MASSSSVVRSVLPTVFRSAAEHRAALQRVAALPAGFRVGTHAFEFRPVELPTKPATMTLTLITLDAPTPSFAAMYTRNAFPGAPVHIGRARLDRSHIQGIIVNNKISNVCAPGGVEASEAVCSAVAAELRLPSGGFVIPCSTGVIGWRLPVDAMVAAVPAAVRSLQSGSALPAATGIMTTDMYPKLRSVQLPGGGRIVGIAKGAGMIEPNLATMLVYLLTDVTIARDDLRAMLPRVVDTSFNALSIDSDQSTSDTVVAVSTNAAPMTDVVGFESALRGVCEALAEDVVRNGEGVQHVLRVAVRGAPSNALARAIGKSVVNSPLFKCAVAGNDPNVGRLVAAVGKCIGNQPEYRDMARVPDLSRARMSIGGIDIFDAGAFKLNPATEERLVAYLRHTQLWESRPRVSAAAVPIEESGRGRTYKGMDVAYDAPVDYPVHERNVEIDINLGIGDASFVTLGSDLTHEYVAENADYRS